MHKRKDILKLMVKILGQPDEQELYGLTWERGVWKYELTWFEDESFRVSRHNTETLGYLEWHCFEEELNLLGMLLP